MNERIPITPDTSTVLGYGGWTKDGALFWEQLDWGGVRKDGGTHFFNPYGGDYLHVRCKAEGKWDRKLKDRCWYRVRCRWSIGERFKRRKSLVKSVGVQKVRGGWEWVVELESEGEHGGR